MPPTTPGVDERPTDVTPGTGTATTGTGLPMVTTDKPGKSVLPFLLFSSLASKRGFGIGFVMIFSFV